MIIDKNIFLEKYNNIEELLNYISETLNIHVERLKIIEHNNYNNKTILDKKIILDNQFILIISEYEVIHISDNNELQKYQNNNVLKKYIIFEDCCKSFIVCKKTISSIEKYKKMKSIILIRDEEILNIQWCDKIRLFIDDFINKNNINNSFWNNKGNNVNATDIFIEKYINENNILKEIDNDILKIIKKIVELLENKYLISCTGDSGYNLRKIFGETRCHIDGILGRIKKLQISSKKLRNMSVIIALNDDYEGGEFYFPKQDYRVKLKKGDIICFPPYYTHPHMVEAPLNRTYRYTINTWLYE